MTTVVAENATTTVDVSSSPSDVNVTVNEISVAVTTSSVDILTVGVQGPQGPQGPAAGATTTLIAGENLGGHRVVRQVGGLAYYADETDPHDVVGVTNAAAGVGTQVDIVLAGEMEEPSWSWSPGAIYLGAGANLTQTPPSGTPTLRVGVALTSTRLAVTLDQPIY